MPKAKLVHGKPSSAPCAPWPAVMSSRTLSKLRKLADSDPELKPVLHTLVWLLRRRKLPPRLDEWRIADGLFLKALHQVAGTQPVGFECDLISVAESLRRRRDRKLAKSK